jgi:hypothetical protein
MQPSTVLAGPVQFSPAEIAFLLTIMVLAGLVLSAPGWVALGHAARRRAKARGAQSRGRAWAWVGGALLGVAVSAVVSSVVAAALDGSEHIVAAMVVASWASCWGLAVAMHPPHRRRETERWGR